MHKPPRQPSWLCVGRIFRTPRAHGWVGILTGQQVNLFRVDRLIAGQSETIVFRATAIDPLLAELGSLLQTSALGCRRASVFLNRRHDHADRLGRDLQHRVRLVDRLRDQAVGLRVLTGAAIVTAGAAVSVRGSAASPPWRHASAIALPNAPGPVSRPPTQDGPPHLASGHGRHGSTRDQRPGVGRRLGITTATLAASVNSDGTVTAVGQQLPDAAAACAGAAVRDDRRPEGTRPPSWCMGPMWRAAEQGGPAIDPKRPLV